MPTIRYEKNEFGLPVGVEPPPQYRIKRIRRWFIDGFRRALRGDKLTDEHVEMLMNYANQKFVDVYSSAYRSGYAAGQNWLAERKDRGTRIVIVSPDAYDKVMELAKKRGESPEGIVETSINYYYFWYADEEE